MPSSNYENPNRATKLVVVLSMVAILFAAFMFVKIRKVSGHELGVLETWGEGVQAEPLTPKTHFFFPGFTNSVYNYDMGMQLYVMNDKDNREEVAEGRKSDAYVVQSKDQQDMRISLRVQWLRRPEKVVDLHKVARDQVEERILRPRLLNVVKNQATLRTALEAYSGEGLVKLQSDILRDLQSDPELNQYLKIDSFVVEHIGLDKDYTKEIVARQVAVQERLKNIEQTKAAEAAADKAKAVAQADYEKILVEARRDKEKGILDAEKTAQQQILAAEAAAKQVALQAEAEKNRNVLIAQGEREAAENRAQAILALGEAEAEAQKLKLSAYAVPGADAFVKIEIAKSFASGVQNIKGYLPERMNVNLLADQYANGINVLVNGGTPPTSN
jgi:regulator of protease activity HflC (stomatin/prohibitin superfamily)